MKQTTSSESVWPFHRDVTWSAPSLDPRRSKLHRIVTDAINSGLAIDEARRLAWK